MLRSAAICGLIAVLVAPAAATPKTTLLPPPVHARTIYVARPDLRLCPSPRCGGYWVSRANHARTRCHDGLFRPRCYVAAVFAEGTRRPLARGLAANSLVRAVIGSTEIDGFGRLGTMTVTEIWQPVTQEAALGDYFRLRDTGVRCIRAPCFSFRTWRVNRPYRVTVSDLDLAPARSNPDTLLQAEAALVAPEGLLASGRIAGTAGGGRIFRATQVFLRVATPRS